MGDAVYSHWPGHKGRIIGRSDQNLIVEQLDALIHSFGDVTFQLDDCSKDGRPLPSRSNEEVGQFVEEATRLRSQLAAQDQVVAKLRNISGGGGGGLEMRERTQSVASSPTNTERTLTPMPP